MMNVDISYFRINRKKSRAKKLKLTTKELLPTSVKYFLVYLRTMRMNSSTRMTHSPRTKTAI